MCHPPLTRVARGRPRKERLRADKVTGRRGLGLSALNEELENNIASAVGRVHYSTCGEKGHNRLTCRRPHF